jgi:tripeptide aminopeptidase
MNKKINRKKLLIDVLSIQTTSGNEYDMITYIYDFCKKNVPEAEVVIKDNNIYVTKGESDNYPCIVAHTDTVHDIHKFYKVFDDDGCLFAFNAETGKQVGVGGDDKVGVWIALEMLKSFDRIKCAFFHSEEIGCVGSRNADMEWFKNVGYCFQADRRGNTDFVNSISGKLFSKKFSKTIKPILKHYGYKETSGAITDVGQLAENGIGVCVANMSCGYYAPHSDEEVVEFEHANNCLNMIEMLVTELADNRYEFQFQTRYGNYNYNYDYDYDYGDWYGANKSFWYGEDKESEVVFDEEGKEYCYYCGCKNLEPSAWSSGKEEWRFCPDCNSDIMLEETNDPNQIKIDYDEYEDISDNYDGSMKHKQIVNKYLTDYHKNK